MARQGSWDEARADGDRIAWETIDSRVPPPRPEGYRGPRPQNYAEMGVVYLEKGFEYAWSAFLHEFFYWRTADHFAVPPPPCFEDDHAALLAGAAEYLCDRYGLTEPVWVDDPIYILAEEWDPWVDIVPGVRASMGERRAKTPPQFLKHNMIYEARNLITL